MSQSSNYKPRVSVTKQLPKEVEERMVKLFDTTLRHTSSSMTQDELKSAIANCEVFVPTVTDIINSDIISAASDKLRLIANFGAGTDHIDINFAHQRGIIVTNTPGVLTEDTADLTMALILAVPRRLVEGDRRSRSGKFEGWTPTFMLGHRIKGKRLGIIGMGRIGQAVARRAKAFGLEVHYHNRSRLPAGIEDTLDATYWPTLDPMLPSIDIVVITCPSTPETYHLINKKRLKLLSPTSYIVNTSRGEVIDEKALAIALSNGELSGAGLDVYEDEPQIHPDLIKLQNVILSPHIGSATYESRQEMGEKVMINIRAMVDGHAYPDRVLPRSE